MKSTEEIIARLRDRDNVHDGDVDEAADRLEELVRERAEMLAALRNRRIGDREDGLTLRDSAACFCISPVALSKWTSDDPTTEPDFVD
jgi:hypothetical protein